MDPWLALYEVQLFDFDHLVILSEKPMKANFDQVDFWSKLEAMIMFQQHMAYG